MKTPRFSPLRTLTGRSRLPTALPAAVTVLLMLMLALPPSLGASPIVRTNPLSVAAVSIPTSTPESGGFSQPTPQPGTATACARASTVAPDWPLLLCDNFDSNVNGRWSTGIVSDDYAISSRTVVDGKYRWQQKALQGFASVVKDLDYKLTDFFVAVDAQLLDGPKTAQYGLSFRQVDSNNYYAFVIDNQGQYRFDVLTDNKWTNLIPWTDNSSILTDQVNRLAVEAHGDQFTFYVNDRQIDSATDDKLTQGMVGIATDMDANDQALFEFDNFEIRAPQSSVVASTPTPSSGSPAPATAQPTAAAVTCDQDAAVAPQDWTLGLCDGFADNQNSWPTGAGPDQLGKVAWDIGQGAYRWTAQTTQGLFQVARPSFGTLTDFYVSTIAERTSGADDSAYSVVFRWVDSDNFYAFNVDGTKNFAVYLMYRGQWQTLQDTTPSDAVKAGQPNLLAVKAVGSTLTFFINNQQVAQFNDSRLTSGQPGLGVDLHANESMTVDFTSFEVRTPPSSPVVGPTATSAPPSQPTPTSRPSSTPTPMPTATPGESFIGCGADDNLAPPDWSPILCDAFTNNDGEWPDGPTNSSTARITRSVADGAYTWDVDALKSGNVYSAWYGTSADKKSDIYVGVDARRVSGPADTGYGIQFRVEDLDNFYDFKIDDTKEFKAQVLVNNEWTTLADWTPTDAVRPGDWNRLAIQAEGDLLIFWINGQQVLRLSDNHLTEGRAGLAVTTNDVAKSTIEFTNFSIWTP